MRRSGGTRRTKALIGWARDVVKIVIKAFGEASCVTMVTSADFDLLSG